MLTYEGGGDARQEMHKDAEVFLRPNLLSTFRPCNGTQVNTGTT